MRRWDPVYGLDERCRQKAARSQFIAPRRKIYKIKKACLARIQRIIQGKKCQEPSSQEGMCAEAPYQIGKIGIDWQ